MRKKKLYALLAVVFVSQLVSAQPAAQPADNGMGVVLGVLGIAFAGLFVFLIATDLKLRRLENEIRNRKK